MRPVRLDVENFMSFQSPEPIEFEDVDLFVLAGPTGAGKSAVIDAMVFSLYGQIPRLQDARLKEPVINRTAGQARVRFDFAVGDDRYRTVWVVTRKDGGGATSEAVLERVLPELDDDGEQHTKTLEHSSRDVPDRVKAILGLSYDEFCKTVVLPQGAFAEMLHGDRSDRQEMMVRLLDLGVYADIGSDARLRAKTKQTRLDTVDEQLAGLADATDEAVAAAEDHLDQLTAVKSDVDDQLVELDDLRAAFEEAQREADAVADKVKALADLERPDGLGDLAADLEAAETRVEAAEEHTTTVTEALEDARESLEGFPAPAEIDRAATADDALTAAREAVPDLEQAVADAEERVEAAEEAHGKAGRQLDEAREHREQLRRDNMAAVLAHELDAGDDCPVCQRTLDTAPATSVPDGLDDAEERVTTARSEADEAGDEHQQATTAKATAEAELRGGREKVRTAAENLDEALAALPDTVIDDGLDRGALDQLARERETAAEAVEAHKRERKQARQDLASARKHADELSDAAARAWTAFSDARDTVSAHGAPQPGDLGIAEAWDQLLEWAADTLTEARGELKEAKAAVEDAKAAGEAHKDEIVAMVADVGVEVDDQTTAQGAGQSLAAAIQQSKNTLATVTERVERRGELEEEAGQLRGEVAVATTLGRILRTDRFEQWLLTRLSYRLVRGASDILGDLTHGGYSITVSEDDGSFQIVDHTNADERRSARTLSGGETFLASLSLALSLAEHVAAISRQGAARLDALFLDEGFGTLDPAALDTVADAIEELSSSQDRMVGLITHVRDLADRIPVRYEVSKAPTGSTVSRIDEPDAPTPVGAREGDL